MSAARMGVCIISRNRLWRESLARILSRRIDFFAFSMDQVDPEFAKSHCKVGNSILLFDSANSFFEEIRAILGLLEPAPGRKIVVLGIEENAGVFIELVLEGVQGFLLKDASAMDVVTALRAVARGEVVCPPCLCRFLFENVVRNHICRPTRGAKEAILTRREVQILPLVARGLTNKEIASQFHLAEQTVKNHVHSILHKTGAKDRVEALDICYQMRVEIPLH